MQALTEREIIQTVVDHFIRDRNPCAVDWNGAPTPSRTCHYLCENGARCAIGVFLQDIKPKQWSSVGVDFLPTELLVQARLVAGVLGVEDLEGFRSRMKLLSDVQSAHDTAGKEAMGASIDPDEQQLTFRRLFTGYLNLWVDKKHLRGIEWYDRIFTDMPVEV